jgi:hypothetical protein
MLPPQDVQLRFEEPSSLADGRIRRRDLAQRVAELQAAISSVNGERPPRSQTNNYQNWVERRGRAISAHRKTVAELQFVKNWLNNATREVFGMESDRPSVQIKNFSHVLHSFEYLFLTVSDFFDTDSEESYEAMRKAYNRLAIELGAKTTDNNEASEIEGC